LIKSFNQSIGYICASCSAINYRDINIFELVPKKNPVFPGGVSASFECIGKNCDVHPVAISQTKDKYKIMINCPFCGEIHDFSIGKAAFWAKDYMAFKCNMSNMDVLFIGDKKKIREELEKQEDMLEDMSEDLLEEFTKSGMLTPEIEIIMDIVNEMYVKKEERAVFCQCGSENVDFEVEPGALRVFCKDCNEVDFFPLTQKTLDFLLEDDIFILKK